MNIHVKQSFDVAAYLDHVKATHKRMISPANAVKDTGLARRAHRVKVEDHHDDEPLPVEQEVKSPEKRSEAVLERLQAIKDVYVDGISASKIAELLGTSKNVVIGFYRRNPDELRAYPLVAHPGRKGKE